MEKIVICSRVKPELKARLDMVSDKARNPFAPSRAQIIERGIELALNEYERKSKK